MLIHRRSIAVLMATVAAAAVEMAILPCWLWDEISPPSPFEVRDLCWGFWPVFLLAPVGFVAAVSTLGRVQRFFAVATGIGLMLAAGHLLATREIPWALDRATGRIHALVMERLPAWLFQELLRRESAGESLTAWSRCLDLLMALPTISLSLVGGWLASRRGLLACDGLARTRPDPAEAPRTS